MVVSSQQTATACNSHNAVLQFKGIVTGSAAASLLFLPMDPAGAREAVASVPVILVADGARETAGLPVILIADGARDKVQQKQAELERVKEEAHKATSMFKRPARVRKRITHRHLVSLHGGYRQALRRNFGHAGAAALSAHTDQQVSNPCVYTWERSLASNVLASIQEKIMATISTLRMCSGIMLQRLQMAQVRAHACLVMKSTKSCLTARIARCS